MQYLHSIAAYADHLLDSEATPFDIKEINRMNEAGEWSQHRHIVMRDFRNQFNLWDPEHPLTKNWHQNEDARDIRAGIDFSADHPDYVSARILEAFEAKILTSPLKNHTPDFIYHTEDGSIKVVNGLASVNPSEPI